MKAALLKLKLSRAIGAATIVSLALAAAVLAEDANANKTAKSPSTKTTTPAKKPATAHKRKPHRPRITEEQALRLVENLPEIKQFMRDVKQSKVAQPTMDVDRTENNAYVVHVYEIVNDGPHNSHTATKNWYYVNMQTGKITTEF